MEAKAAVMMFEERMRQMEASQLAPVRMREVFSQEIQTEAVEQETVYSPVLEGNISEQDVTDRINLEKEKLGEMMDDLKLRILELEESRKKRERAVLSEATRDRETPSVDLNDTLNVCRLIYKNHKCKLCSEHVWNFVWIL